MIRNVCLAAAFALCLAAPPSASAYWPYFGFGGYYGGYGYGYGSGYYAPTNYVPAPPYYSLFPPVYYSSQITARHYGASPFAWYAGMEPITYAPLPEPPAEPAPEMIENPYVRGAKATSAKAAMIENPYFKGAKTATAQTTANGEVQPLMIVNPHVASVSR
jgi:hypothetical protein